MRHLAVAGTLALAIFLSGSFRLPAQQAKPAPVPNRALLDQYCVTCHNQRAKTAGLTFDTMDLSHAGADAAVWERAVRKLRGGMMPPPGSKRPDQATVDAFLASLEAALDQAAAANPNPGSVPLHRLNRVEYANAMRDLFAVDVDAAALLPTDDISNGFDNIASVLKVSPSFLDQYITAARAVTQKAIGTAPPSKPVTEALTVAPGSEPIDLPPGARSGTVVEHLFPFDGEYEFRAPAGGAVLLLDGAKIPAGARVPLKAGLHKVASVTPGRSFVEGDGLLAPLIPGAGGGAGFGGGGGGGGRGGRGGGGGGGLQVVGPYNPTGAPIETLNRQKIFVCHPTSQADESACANKIFANIGHRAFRRPVTDKDLAAPMAFFKEGRSAGDFDAGIQSGLIAIIASPKFLYRAEPPPQNLKPGSIYHVSDLDLASRLSFFLWSSIPDEELLGLAEQGKLKDPKIFEQQVRRMLADAKSKTLETNFGFEWLRVREVDKLDPDQIVYPNFDASLRTAFKREMEMFLESVFREDHSVLDLLTANYTFVNERLAAHYGIPDVRGDQFRRVTLPDSRRDGLLGKGAILMVTAYPNRTSPVLRGAYILESITGTPPSPPPPNVPPFKENKDGEAAHTVREIMEQHRANPTCNACHGVMDPLGFSLENFDTIGAWRNKDRFAGTVIDASGKLVDGTSVTGPDDLRNALMKRPEQFVQTMTEKMMIYGLGRTLEPYDMPAIRKIVRDAAPTKYRFSSLVMGIVTSPAFQMSRIPENTPAAAQVATARP